MDTLSHAEAAEMIVAMDAPAPEEVKDDAPEVDEAEEASAEGAAETDEVADAADSEAEAEESEAEDESDEQDAEAAPAIEAPKWWDAEDKAAFATLSPAQQAIIAKNEAKREAVIQKEKTAYVEGRKVAVANAEKAAALVSKLEAAIPDDIAAFNKKYGDIDWQAFPSWARENPQEALAFQAEYHAEKTALEARIADRAEADKVARETFAKEQLASLQEVAPELANETALKALGDYAVKAGIKSEDFVFAEASHLTVLNKARLYDEMMAKAAATPPVPPQKQTPTAPAKVPPKGAARPVQTSQERTAQQARNRFNQTRTSEDAAALLIAQGYI